MRLPSPCTPTTSQSNLCSGRAAANSRTPLLVPWTAPRPPRRRVASRCLRGMENVASLFLAKSAAWSPRAAALRGVCGSVLPTASGAPGSQPSSAAAASAPAFGPPGMAGPRLYLRRFPVRFGGQTTNASPSGLSRRKAGPGCKPRRRLSCLKARLSNTGSGQGL